MRKLLIALALTTGVAHATPNTPPDIKMIQAVKECEHVATNQIIYCVIAQYRGATWDQVDHYVIALVEELEREGDYATSVGLVNTYRTLVEAGATPSQSVEGVTLWLTHRLE